MLIIISPFKKDNLFLKGKNNHKLLFLNKICDLKKNKDKNNILLIDCNCLNEQGIINEYNYMLEEVFITININLVIALNSNNLIIDICKFYNVDLFIV